MNPNWRPGGQPQQQQPQFQQQPQQQQFGQQPGLGFGGGLQPQPTGFPQQQRGFLGPQPTGFQPQPTGFQPQQTGFQPQQTGFQQQSGFQQQPGFQQPQQTGFPGLQPQASQPQQQRFLSPSPGLVPQATGWQGGGGGGGLAAAPLVPQATGYHDPRVQMMTSTFMPAAGFQQGGALQFAGGPQPGQSLHQSIQQHNEQNRGTAAPRIPWKLTRDEQKNYDQIFRAWDQGSTGFISGQMALEVFGQSGLPREDLAKIWTLADADNRGKLNLAEFHVAMGLIFRRLNGNEVPDILPPELVPASARDLGDQVGFLKDLLKNDTNVRATNSSPASRAPQRSFHDTSSPSDRKDGTVYRHDDTDIKAYKSSARHIDRSRVRFGDDSPSADLEDMKRQLSSASKALDKASKRSSEDDDLDEEMDELKARVRRVQDDLEYVSRGPRTSSKDQERRKLEREMLELMHERIPEVERKIADRDRRRKDEDRDWARDRDKRNAGYRSRDDDYDRDRDYRDRDRERERERERDVGYLRGSYDRPGSRGYDDERPRSRGYDDRDRPRSRNRPRSPSRSPSPPPRKARTPAPAPSGPSADSAPPPPPPAPATPAPKGETKEERAARLRAQTQAKLQARMRELGVAGYSGTESASTTPNPVEERLEAERKEAEEKAKNAEREAEEMEARRKARLEQARGGSTPAPAAPAPPAPKPAPPAPTPRGAPKPPAPPVVTRTAPKAPAPAPAPPAPAPAPPAAPSFEDEEDEELQRRQKALEDRRKRLEALRKEEEEAQRAEAEFEAKRAAGRSPAPPAAAPPAPAAQDSKRAPPPPVRSRGSAFKQPEPTPEPAVPDEDFEAPAPPPPPPPAPPAPAPSASSGGSTNPFFKLQQGGAPAATAAASPASNPWGAPAPTEPESAAPPPPPPPPPAPVSPSLPAPSRTPTIAAPVASKGPYNKPPAHDDPDDWDVIQDKEQDDDSSDDEFINRNSRQRIAEQLFSGILPGRPQSAGPPGGNGSRGATPVGGPKSAGPSLGGAPDAPPPPPAPPAPKLNLPPPAADPSDRSALLGAIQMGARLRKTVTNDRSGVGAAGAVVGDAAPPSHINTQPIERESSPPPQSIAPPPAPAAVMSADAYETTPAPNKTDYRQSVDWYSGLAAEGIPPAPASSGAGVMPSMQEEEEPHAVPAIQVEAAANDEFADVDMSVSKLVRSLYPYDGQRAEDLSFAENMMIDAYPSKSGGDWWYGTISKTGKKGFFPRSYVDVVEKVLKAKAQYAYEGTNADELPLVEGDILSIVDNSEADWWKAEKDGMVFIVPAGYLELLDGQGQRDSLALPSPTPRGSGSDASDGRRLSSSSVGTEPESSSDEEYEDEAEGEAMAAAAAARAQERQRVLEAAGLIVKKAPPRPPRKRRRPAPKAPVRERERRGESLERPSFDESTRRASMSKELPEPPLSPAESVLRIDDAYERYQAFRESRTGRASMSSFEGGGAGGLGVVIPPGPPSPSGTTTSLPSSVPSTADQTKLAIKNFFGRVSGSERPSTSSGSRVISAPVISAPVSAVPERGNSPAFGMSWSSLVDKSVVEGIPDGERKRQEAIFELIATESAYKFYASMVPMLDDKSATVIFANVEDILLCNTTFLSSLEERQKDCRLYIDQIGDILDAHMSGMAVYMPYCVHQAPAIKVLQGLRETNQELAGHLQARELRLRDEDPDIRNLDLSSYLLIPMQRITRYPLLMKQILHHTQQESERAYISHAIQTTERLLDAVNEAIREREGAERLGEISKGLYVGQGHLDLTAPTRYMGPRRLLKEGVLVKAKSGRRLQAVLCNDIFVLMDAAAQSLYRMPMSLTELVVKEGKDEVTLLVQVAYPRGGDTIALRAGSARDARAWIESMDKARAEAGRWLMSATGGGGRRSSVGR
ncbi:actin cytoskeleton-regulatory complex protein pan1 [Ceratobasidium sp. AG-Ba]|nr:actin cytoskeleton-regulatory complex protein pan1 [Ceratobasidium sp. AG-Ba]